MVKFYWIIFYPTSDCDHLLLRGGGNLHPRRAPCELLGEYTSQGKPKIPPADSHTARRLHINIDGIPLFNSLCLCLASSQLCPTSWWKRVSQCFAAIENPQSVDEYLHDFVSEMQKLEMLGVSDNSTEFYSIELVAVICDAPTGSCVKFIKGHSRYNCCE